MCHLVDVSQETFELAVNQNIRIIRSLALYIDKFMKQGVQGVSDDAIDNELERFMKLFRHISDKVRVD